MLDYNYWVKENFAVGLHTDLILENFQVEELAEEGGVEGTIELKKPASIVGAVSYCPLEWVGFVTGGGIKYEASESFGLMCFGVEPTWEVSEKWEIFINLSYNIKFSAYNTYGLSIGIGRAF